MSVVRPGFVALSVARAAGRAPHASGHGAMHDEGVQSVEAGMRFASALKMSIFMHLMMVCRVCRVPDSCACACACVRGRADTQARTRIRARGLAPSSLSSLSSIE